MNTYTSTRRPMKRYARDSSQRKNMDLNAPSMETQMHEGTSNPVSSRASQGASAPMNSRRGSQLPANDGSHSLPIDVEAIDDDVLIISSSSRFPQTMRSRTSHPVTVVLDEDHEVHPAQAGVAIEDSVTTLSLNSHNKRVRIPPNTMIINCDVYSAVEDNHNVKRKRVANPHAEPEKAVPKEPTFTCPVCLSTLTEACSTICGHVFCQRCIKASIQAQKKCPACRRKLTINNFHRVYLPTTN
ncbi:E3 ubiquitin-protein ligase RNF4-like isoform X1 [Phoenix dactylifera]|uniref:E3 ubiquitin-protein ligase RNF4-like isoform X1 n=1 Tax=Phoenix dactylifera TaxID=42345 RepID=A0A8B7BZZ8_PHODC|nr:E3 ubiquitin-protein ligase RNF4-like isoform X1 [Phoenix dactylifera]